MRHLSNLACLLAIVATASCSSENTPTKPLPTPPAAVVLGFDDPVPISNAGLAGPLSNMAVGDFNGDGKADIAIGMTDSSKIWVSYGLGGGLFDVGKSFYSGPRPSAIRAASLGSGAPTDLVVGGTGAIVVLSGLAGESFSTPETLTTFLGTPKEFATGDFDRDGITDIAATVYFPPGQGDATALYASSGFPRAITTVETAPGNHIAAGNVGGDSNIDVIVTGPASGGTMAVFLGNGNGTFQPPDEVAVGSAPGAIALLDLDRDGKLEMGVTFNASPGLSIFRSQPPASVVFDSTYAEGYAASCAATGDVNLDGRADVVLGSLGTADVWIFANDGHGNLKFPFAAFTSSATDQIAIADLDGDGKNDILLGYLSSGGGLRYIRNTTQ